MGGGTNLDAYINLGVILEQKGKIADAEDKFRKALTIVPCDPVASSNLAVLLGGQAPQ
jgi:Flp pilus assembly protein TadD